jgi:hypothetical protein
MRTRISRLAFLGVVLIGLSAASGLPLAAQTYSYYPVPGCRLADTRAASYNAGGFANGSPSLQGGTTRAFFVKGPCGIPNTAKAVSVNASVVNPSAQGYATVWPAGTISPGIAMIDFGAGQPAIGNAIIVPLMACSAPCGDLNVFFSPASGQTGDFVLDVTGYFQ